MPTKHTLKSHSPSILFQLFKNSTFALPFLPMIFLAFHLKSQFLEMVGYHSIARGIGVEGFNQIERLGFFASDFLVVGAVIPLFVAMLYTCFPYRRVNHIIVFASSLSFTLILFSQLQAINTVGTFMPLDMITAAIQWAIDDPVILADYASPGKIIKLALLFTVLIVGSVTAIYLNNINRTNNRLMRHTKGIVICFMVIFFSLSLGIKIAYSGINLMPIEKSPFHQSILSRSIEALFENNSISNTAEKSINTLVNQHNTLANNIEAKETPAYFGQARDYDVVLFILETAPLKTSSLSAVPTLKSLESASFTSKHHFTTYPVTSFALFSIFTSMYPKPVAHFRYQESFPSQTQLPSFILNMNNAGYDTKAFLPMPLSYSWDKHLFKHLKLEPQVSEQWDEFGPWVWETKYKQDRASLEMLKQYINYAIDKNQRYGVVYLPEVGHAPWHDFGNADLPMHQRGKRLLELQDRWIAELVNLLKEKGRLNKTLIVVTGDHGIRTKIEDPAFPGNIIDDYSFRVPLQIYAPGILNQKYELSHNTSHIDISPTLNHLLGLSSNSLTIAEQGRVLWSDQLDKRHLFYLAQDYLGADGLFDDSGYWSLNHMTGISYHNPTNLKFDSKNSLPYDCGPCEGLSFKLKNFAMVQDSLLHKLAMTTDKNK